MRTRKSRWRKRQTENEPSKWAALEAGAAEVRRLQAEVAKESVECEESPNGRHKFNADLEYDPSGATINCEHCGDVQTVASPKKRKRRRRKKR
jgi:hypothetical protein